MKSLTLTTTTLMRSLAVFVALLGIPAVQSQAQIVLDFRNDGGIGELLETAARTTDPETNPVSQIQDGVTFTANATSTLNNSAPFFNRQDAPGDTSGGSGVDSGVGFGGGDATLSGIDPGEELTFTITFGNDVSSLSISQIDFFLPDDARNTATVSIAGNDPVTLFDGFGSEFDDDQDLYTLASPIEILSGDTIAFSNTSASAFFFFPSYQVAGITFNAEATAVPEPSSVAMLGLGGVLMLVRRKRA